LLFKAYECRLLHTCALWLGFAKRDSGLRFKVFAWRCRVVRKGMSSSSHGSNSDGSDASYGGLRLELLSSSSESLHIEVEREVCKDPPSEHVESSWLKRGGNGWVAEGVKN